MDSGVSGDVSEEEGVRNIVIREVRELPTSSQCTGIVIGQVQRDKSKLEVSKSCVFDTSEIETAIRHINMMHAVQINKLTLARVSTALADPLVAR